MKKITLLLLMLISGTVFGQNTDTKIVTTANAAIIQALQITAGDDLEFGILIPEYSSITSYTLGTDGTTHTGTAKVLSTSTQTSATYQITSEENQSFKINIPEIITLAGPLSATMDVTLDTNIGTPTGGVITHTEADGLTDLIIGGTIDIGANQTPGPYSTTFDVTISYE